jgi:hypothetical protein
MWLSWPRRRGAGTGHAQGISQQVLGLEAFDSYINNDVARLAPLINGTADKR